MLGRCESSAVSAELIACFLQFILLLLPAICCKRRRAVPSPGGAEGCYVFCNLANERCHERFAISGLVRDRLVILLVGLLCVRGAQIGVVK